MTSLPPQPLSPLDGRYRAAVGELGEHLSEAGLNRARVHVEVEWLIAQTDRGFFGSSPLSAEQKAQLRSIVTEFGQADIDELAALEATTRHDVKAVEYYVRRRLELLGLDAIAELTHFACTSEDINNLSYAITVRDAVRRGVAAQVPRRHRRARRPSRSSTATPRCCRARTASPRRPSTMGKELAVFAYRLERIARQVEATEYLGKFSGATGTFSAHVVAAPDVAWPDVSREFVESLGLTWNPLTTQIESHDWQAELYARISHANRVLHNLATDIWTYISLGYFRQIPQAGATGSSTMPHKVNPIRFENAEANLELSSAVLDSLAATLVTSRLQRDLTDSSAQRNIGVGFGHSLLALDNIQRGLGEIDLDRDAPARRPRRQLGGAGRGDPDGHPRRGRRRALHDRRSRTPCSRSSPAASASARPSSPRSSRASRSGMTRSSRLLALTPATYTGIASELVDRL